MKPWLKKTITVVATLLVLVITYFVLAAFLPRWWAQRIAGLAEGGFSRGILWGLLFGILCTAIPLVLLVWVWQVRGWKFGRGVQIALTVLALVVAIPNLMTLSVVLGGGNAAHAVNGSWMSTRPDSAEPRWSGLSSACSCSCCSS